MNDKDANPAIDRDDIAEQASVDGAEPAPPPVLSAAPQRSPFAPANLPPLPASVTSKAGDTAVSARQPYPLSGWAFDQPQPEIPDFGDADVPHVSLMRLLLQSWLGLFMPGRSIRAFAAASHARLAAVVFINTVLVGVLTMALALSSDSQEREWSSSLARFGLPEIQYSTLKQGYYAAPPGSEIVGYEVVDNGFIVFRSYAQVWTLWDVKSPLSVHPAVVGALVVVAMVWGLAAFATLLLLSYACRKGLDLATLGRAARAVLACTSVLALPAITIAILIIMVHRFDLRTRLGMGGRMETGFGLAFMGAVSIVYLLFRMSSAARAMTPVSRLKFPDTPLCEDCGYDLTHTPESGLCSECGLAIAESIGPQRRRRGVSWQNSVGQPGSMLQTMFSVLLSPGAFYRNVRLRSDEGSSAWFGRTQFSLMAIVAAVWAVGIIVLVNLRFPGGPSAFAQLMMIGLAVCAVVTLGWIVRNFVATAAACMWTYRHPSPPPAAIQRVRDFETTFLAVICFYNASLITTFIVFDDSWTDVSRWFAQTFAAPLTPLLLFWGSVAIILIWMLRYLRIAKAVRYGNC